MSRSERATVESITTDEKTKLLLKAVEAAQAVLGNKFQAGVMSVIWSPDAGFDAEGSTVGFVEPIKGTAHARQVAENLEDFPSRVSAWVKAFKRSLSVRH